jgi:hypothetical protein
VVRSAGDTLVSIRAKLIYLVAGQLSTGVPLEQGIRRAAESLRLRLYVPIYAGS